MHFQLIRDTIPIGGGGRAPSKELGDLFGIFFEDLNHAADGGLYAELLQNRSFEFDPVDNPSYHSLTAWETIQRGPAPPTAMWNAIPR